MNAQDFSTLPHCGTHLVVDPKVLHAFVDGIGRRCVQEIEAPKPNLGDAHNAMALYTLMMLLFATGHRAVKDPFFSLDVFNLVRGECLIEDKVVSAARQARLVWLPDVAIAQLHSYLIHLDALARRLSRTDQNLACAIWAATQPDGPRPLPLFFFLEGGLGAMKHVAVSPSTLKGRLADAWSLPLNANRHVLATGLRALRCPAELVEVQLGHEEGELSPFGVHSPLSPERVGQLLRAYLKDYMQDQGWRPLTGLRGDKGLRHVSCKSTRLSECAMGPAEREARREAGREDRWRAELRTVADALRAYSATGPSREISDDEVKALETKLLAKDLPVSTTLFRLTLFRRQLLTLRKAGYKVRIPGRLATAREERSPFKRDTLSSAREAERVRGRFIQHLESSVPSTPPPERRVAEVLISAVLFGALLAKEWQAQIPARLLAGLQYKDDIVFVDLPYRPGEPDAPLRRWLPDPVTLSLITGLWRSARGVGDRLDIAQVLQHAQQILKAMGVPRDDRPRGGLSASESALVRVLSPLTSLSLAYWSLRLPGVLRAYATTPDFSASLPPASWYRVITKRKITAKGIGQDAGRPAPVTHHDSLVPVLGSVPHVAQARVAWKELGATLSLTRLNAKVPRIRKRALEERLATFANNPVVRASSVATLLCGWLLHLCRHGSSHQRNLRASSIVTYAATIGPLLLEFGGPLDMLGLTDVGFEDLYSRVVGTSSRKHVQYVAERLREFHRFLQAAYALPAVDWAEVFEGPDFDAVDAAVVTRREYLEALDLVLNDEGGTERDRSLHAFVLVMAYHFGLRTGEIFRLTGGDVLRAGDEVVVYVRNSTYGFTKTDNGIRQVPLLGRLLAREYDIIDKWLGHIDFFATDFGRAALLSRPNLEKQVIEQSAVVSRVVQALRTATGDDNVRLRHLRHTFGTRNFLYAYCDGEPTGTLGRLYAALADEGVTPAEVRTKLLGNEALSSRALYAASAVHGHGSPKTTLGSYIHGLDIALHDEVSRDAPKLPAKALSYALSVTAGHVRQLLFRQKHGLKANTSLPHHWLARLFREDLPPGLIEVSTKRETARLVTIQSPHLKPVDVDWFLSIVGLRQTLDGVADQLFVTESFMRDFLGVASRLQERTGFVDFGLPVYVPEDKWVAGPATRGSELDKEAARARAFLLGIQENEVTRGHVRRLCTAWASAYRRSARELLFSRRPCFYEFLGASQSLGIATDAFEVLIPEQAKDKDDVWESIREELAQKGLRVAGRNRLPASRAGVKSNRIGLALRPHPSHKLGYQRTLNRVLFVLLCYLEQDSAGALARTVGP